MIDPALSLTLTATATNCFHKIELVYAEAPATVMAEVAVSGDNELPDAIAST